MQNRIKPIVPHLLALLSFLVIATLYFLPQVQGKKISSSDIQHYRAMSHEARQFEEETGETALWTNSMFSGMPTYQITGPQKKNLMKPLRDLQQLYISRPIGYFLGAMIGFYILMLVLGLSPLAGAVGAIFFAFSTNNLVLFEAGHMTKLSAVFSVPIFLAGVVLTFRKKYGYGFLIFSIGLALNILHNHLQMTYLLGILTAILMVFYFFKYLKEKDLKHFVKVSLLFLAGAVLAVATSASKIWTTYEYSSETMRGKPILETVTDTPASSSETDGLEWNYAMQWSNGWKDLLSSFIAGAVGGGSAEPVGDDSAFSRKFRQLTGRSMPGEQLAPLYWGDLPGTSGPIYFGAVVFFLFLFGALIVRGPMKWWLVTGVVLTMLFSLGKNLEWFNRFFFDYFPYFNKFRAPNSILSLTVFLIPLLGFLGIRELLTQPDRTREFQRKLYISGGILGGLSLILLLFGGALFDFTSPGDARYEELNLLGALMADRKALLQSDSLKSLFYIGLSGLAIWLYLKKRIKAPVLILSVALIGIIDLFSVGTRYISHNDFQRESRLENEFRKRPVDEQILRDTDPHYRVLDLSINTFNSSMSSYYHKTIGGYHAAKLQRYQDLIDRHIARNNQEVLHMLNTKYIIQGQPGAENVIRNDLARGNAWLVDSLVGVNNANEEIDALNGLNTGNTAVYHQEFSDYINGFDPDGSGSIVLNEYTPNRIRYRSNTSSEQFAVFSEIWYGPGKGWTASVDGDPVVFIRVNYALRGMRIPAGDHEIVFEFKPRSYFIGENISLASSGLLLLMLLFFLGRDAYPIFQKQRA
jgi:hypothetical protein